jgi:hypothetical protein
VHHCTMVQLAAKYIFKTVSRLLCIYVAIEDRLIINEEFYP